MKKGLSGVLIVLLVIVGLAVAFGGFYISKYNGIVILNEDVNNKWGQVQTQYQRRADLLPNLVETVKGYAQHESQTFTQIAELRSGYSKATTPKQLQQLDSKLASAITIAVEAYPQLKANENFLALQDELAGTENRIAVARKDFNEAVTVYNKSIKIFPGNIIAGMSGFTPKQQFEAAAGSENAPVVKFK